MKFTTGGVGNSLSKNILLECSTYGVVLRLRDYKQNNNKRLQTNKTLKP